MKTFFTAMIAVVAISSTQANAQTQIGFRASLSNLSTVGVSGIVEITGPTTLRFYNFTYDGRGGGRTELALLQDRDQDTLRNLNLLDSPFQGFDNGTRGTVVADALGQPQFVQVPLDPAFPEFFPQVDANGALFTPPFFPVEFDTAAVPVANLRGPNPAIDNAPSPFQPFNGTLDVTSLSSFGDNGETLTDVAGVSIFCIPFGLDFGSGIFTSPADFTNDGEVSVADFTSFRDNAGAVAASATPPPDIVDFPSAQAFLAAFENFVDVFDTPGELADANFDGSIDQADFNVFLQQFGTLAAAAQPNTAASLAAFDAQHAAPEEGALEALFAALTGDPVELPEGGVGPFAPLAAEATAVPEPAAALLAGYGLLAIAARRRR